MHSAARVGTIAPEDFTPEPRDRAALLKLLKPRPGLYARLSQMHDCGLLGRLFPEFDAVSWRVVRDFYHKYTVDEHTLLTIRNLERLMSTREPYRERFKTVAASLPSPELLVLALLLHDVGKWRDDEHALESVRMAAEALDRLQLAADARDTVLFLIRNHLQMSLVAFRRDTEDPDIVKEFARLLGTEDRLKMLCLMTLADIEAVSPDTLTPWKEELIWRLYVDTYNHLTQRYGDELIERNQAGLRRTAFVAARTISPRRRSCGFLEGLPQRYLQLFPREAIYRHVRLARDIGADEVHVSLEQNDDGVDAVGRDARQAVPVLEHLRRAVVLRNEHPAGPGADQSERSRPRRVPVHRRRALSGAEYRRARPGAAASCATSSPAAPTSRRCCAGASRASCSRAARRECRPVVRADNEASERYTIVDIVAGNALGLLYRISRVISRHGCSVELVLISTEGEKAIDVFHITKAGSKLTEAEQRALTSDLQSTLEGTL